MNHIRRFARGRKPPAHGQLNQTEQAYQAHLAALKLTGQIKDYGVHRFTLKLGADCRYTPDFDVLELDDTISLHEVKGAKQMRAKDGSTYVVPFAMDDSKAKIRMAATAFPWLRFCIAYRHKGPWIVDEVGI